MALKNLNQEKCPEAIIYLSGGEGVMKSTEIKIYALHDERKSSKLMISVIHLAGTGIATFS